jgi:hypothetical protein
VGSHSSSLEKSGGPLLLTLVVRGKILQVELHVHIFGLYPAPRLGVSHCWRPTYSSNCLWSGSVTLQPRQTITAPPLYFLWPGCTDASDPLGPWSWRNTTVQSCKGQTQEQSQTLHKSPCRLNYLPSASNLGACTKPSPQHRQQAINLLHTGCFGNLPEYPLFSTVKTDPFITVKEN